MQFTTTLTLLAAPDNSNSNLRLRLPDTDLITKCSTLCFYITLRAGGAAVGASNTGAELASEGRRLLWKLTCDHKNVIQCKSTVQLTQMEFALSDAF